MTDSGAARTSIVGRWADFWFEPIPPHVYALLRIALGAVGLLSLAGLTPIELYWPLNGLVPVSSGVLGMRAIVDGAGLGTVVGWAAYLLLLAAFVAMTVGYRSEIAVMACFVGLVLQFQWNRLPLSSAHQVMLNLLFCLVWAESGGVWSLDARRHSVAERPRAESTGVAPWPLWLMRFQIAVVYGASGLWKFANTAWRDGSAVHWALNLNGFHRFPWPLPVAADPFLSLLTWGTLAFELSFPVLVCFRRTRAAALWGGVALHLGLGLTMELGPFSEVMIVSYIAFIDPARVPSLMRAWSGWLTRKNAPARATGAGVVQELEHEPRIGTEI